MSELIVPRTLKGFRDYPPELMLPRESLMETARRVYRSYGFAPIDTPALEYAEILCGKGSDETDKQMYRFRDAGDRDVGMRFDLTVPFARFAAQHVGDLGTPFKRYHIAPVWRGENTQRGRYREFMQCDFDTIGTQSVASDVEIVLVIQDLLQALGIERFTIHINDRRILSGVLERVGLEGQSTAILRALDKLNKVGAARVAEEMAQCAGASAEQADVILSLAQCQGAHDVVLDQLQRLTSGSTRGEEGVAWLRDVSALAESAGLAPPQLRIAPSIARGLDYYTGMVVETFLDDLPEIGSICSGGRYDNLAGLYTKQQLPGIGASLGLDRLLAALEELGVLPRAQTAAPILIPFFEPHRLADYLRLARRLRSTGLGVEVFPEPKKIGQQLKYADRRGFTWAVIQGASEFERGVCQIKRLATGETQEFALASDWAAMVRLLQSP